MLYTKVETVLRTNARSLTRGSDLKSQIKHVHFPECVPGPKPFTAQLPGEPPESFTIVSEERAPRGRAGRECVIYNAAGRRICSLAGLSEYNQTRPNSSVLDKLIYQLVSPNRTRMWTFTPEGNAYAITSELLRQELFFGLVVDRKYEYLNNEPYITFVKGRSGLELGMVWGIMVAALNAGKVEFNTGAMYDLLALELDTARVSELYDDVVITHRATRAHDEWSFHFAGKRSSFSIIKPLPYN